MTDKELYDHNGDTIFYNPINYITSGSEVIENKLPDHIEKAIISGDTSKIKKSLKDNELFCYNCDTNYVMINNSIHMKCEMVDNYIDFDLNGYEYNSDECDGEIYEFLIDNGKDWPDKITLKDIHNNKECFEITIEVIEQLNKFKSLLNGLTIYKIDYTYKIDGIEDIEDFMFDMFDDSTPKDNIDVKIYEEIRNKIHETFLEISYKNTDMSKEQIDSFLNDPITFMNSLKSNEFLSIGNISDNRFGFVNNNIQYLRIDNIYNFNGYILDMILLRTKTTLELEKVLKDLDKIFNEIKGNIYYKIDPDKESKDVFKYTYSECILKEKFNLRK